jgi:phosphotransferase system  glucose/maltose/N-acetylglucosamine-specific IIC component
MRIEPTNPKSNWIELSLICGLFVVLSLVGIIWDFTSGLLTSGIDGIMMLFICLMMGGIFSLMILMIVHQAGLIPFLRPAAKGSEPSAQKASAPSPATPPAAPKAVPAARATSPAAAPPLQPSHPPATLLPPPPPPAPPAAPKPAAKPAPAPEAKPEES